MMWNKIREFTYQREYDKNDGEVYHTFFNDGLSFTIKESNYEIEVSGIINGEFLVFIEQNVVELLHTRGKGIKYDGE